MTAFNSKEIIKKVATLKNKPVKETEEIVTGLFEVFENILANGSNIDMRGYLAIKIKDCKAKKCRNPKTGVEINIPACKKPKVTLGKSLKNAFKK